MQTVHEDADRHWSGISKSIGVDTGIDPTLSRPEYPSGHISLTMPQTSPDMPPRPEFTPFTVPHFCASTPYDGKGFWTYPERCGWIVNEKDMQCHVLCPPGSCKDGMSEEELWEDSMKIRIPSVPKFEREDHTPILASDKVAFLQAWLFFGALAEVSDICGLEIRDYADFLTEDKSEVTTAGLNGLPERWYSALARSGRAGDKAVMEYILKIGRHMSLMLDEEFVDKHVSRFRYTQDECRALHSLDLLLRTIALHLLLHVYMPGFETTEEEGWGHDRVSKCLPLRNHFNEGFRQLSDISEAELEARGWCPSELGVFGHSEVLFASLLSRPRIRDHSVCGKVVCSAYQTDEATYQTRHVENGCNCDFVQMETDALTAALSADQVPKLIISEDLQFQVVTEPGYPYIAISHVWADGLGNTTANALPRCQLRRLRNYTMQLYQLHDQRRASLPLPVAFWMDTMCIPVDPSARLHRKKAIQLLGKTFQEASAVLVLDRELEIVNAITASFLELGLRILTSGWVKRLWTLQEASLASEAQGADKLYFQMQDGPYLYQKYDRTRKALHSLDRNVNEITAEERELLNETAVMLMLGEQIPSVRAIRDQTRTILSPFSIIRSAIEHRTTSKAEDMPVCIASLMGKDLSTILSTSDVERRMGSFYVLMREIPIRVLWPLRQPEKLSISPFRWAPRSITDCVPSDFMGEEFGICDETGVHIRAGGFLLAEGQEKRPDIGGIFPNYAVGIGLAENEKMICHLCVPRDQPAGAPILMGNLALIFRPRDGPRHPEVMVVMIEETNEVVDNDSDAESEIVCRIVGYRIPTMLQEAPETNIWGYALPSDQRWCIT